MAKVARKRVLIESHPRDMPLKELRRHARAAGLGSLGKSYVQKVRSEMPKLPKLPRNGFGVRVRVTPGAARETERVLQSSNAFAEPEANGNGRYNDVPVSFGDLSILPVPATAVQATLQPGLPASDTELRFFSTLVQIGTKRALELLKAYEGL